MKEEKTIEKIAMLIVNWYQENRRMLPWREEKDPYQVWISEIMLQQTKIEAVKGYYARFIKELPDVHALATVKEEELMKLWEGLGYYNRARNLKKAASIIEESYEGKIPNSYEELIKLPGIGEYTAGAIASICFNEKVPAVDGNVLRVLSRVLASKQNVLLPNTKKEMTERIKNIMPQEAGDFNEGIMELGETICIPNGDPLCEQCPIKEECKANKEKLTSEIPVRIKKVSRKIEERTVFLCFYQDKIAIQKREEKGLLAGMYEFPNIIGKGNLKEIEGYMKDWKVEIKEIKKLEEKQHVFSHITWNMHPYQIKVKKETNMFLWVTKQELEEKYALPTAFMKLIK